MKKSSFFFTIALLVLTACSRKSGEARISADIGGTTADTFYLYGADGTFPRIDTIVTKDGRFDHRTKIDTLTYCYLRLPGGGEYPLFLDKGNELTIKGEIANPDEFVVKGNPHNENLTDFLRSLKERQLPADAKTKEAENFIAAHPNSLASVYLIDRYFVRRDTLDIPQIRKLIDRLTGTMKDQPVIIRLTESLNMAERTEPGRYIPHFRLPDAKGNYVDRTSEALREKFLLLHFWASWADSTGLALMARDLRTAHKRYEKNKHLAFVGISFDVEKDGWQAAVKRDSLTWTQLCNFDGLTGEPGNFYETEHLPFNLIIAPDGRIVARNLRGDALHQRLRQLTDSVATLPKK